MPNRPGGSGSGQGRGRGGRGQGGGLGPGNCLCPVCGEKITHQPGKPCYEEKCPKCGAAMVRDRE
jgi:hypothetical protein